jgi:hypothetical protein
MLLRLNLNKLVEEVKEDNQEGKIEEPASVEEVPEEEALAIQVSEMEARKEVKATFQEESLQSDLRQ